MIIEWTYYSFMQQQKYFGLTYTNTFSGGEAVVAVGLCSIIFTAKKPDIGFVSKQPAMTFVSKKPNITFEG